MSTQENINLYKMELIAFWREYKGIIKINLYLYSIYCLILYFIMYIITTFNIHTYLILNCYLLLFIMNFIGRKTDNKARILFSEKTKNLYTTPLEPKKIISLKSLKFTSAFATDSFIIFTPFIISSLILGINFKDLMLYTLLGIISGSILLFIKELYLTKLSSKKTTGLIKSILIGLISGTSIAILNSILTNNNKTFITFYTSFLNNNLTENILYLILIFIPIILFKNKIYISYDFKNKTNPRVKQFKTKRFSIVKGEFSKQLKTSNREGNFTNTFINTLLFYGSFLATIYYSSIFLNFHLLFRIDTFFILSMIITGRNTKIFFNSRSIYNESTMIHTFLFAKYKISKIIFYRVLINIFSTLILNFSFIIILYSISKLEMKFLILTLILTSLFSITISCIQEYYLTNKVKYLVNIGNENKGSIIKRIILEGLLTMLLMYGYLFILFINSNLISLYSTIASFILIGLTIIFSIKILKGNKKFYGELQKYY